MCQPAEACGSKRTVDNGSNDPGGGERTGWKKPLVGEMILKNGEIENGEIGPHVIVTLNGHNFVDLNTPVREQDIIAIFPPTAGG
jgi:hypothetical protein